MRDITLSDLNRIGGRSRSSMRPKLVKAINKYAKNYGIDTVERMAMYLANCRVESKHFTRMDENLWYSAEGLMSTWQSRFKTLAFAERYANKPRKIANYVYGNRMGNRGRPDAGWLYRGSGPGQTTGYNNFKEFENETGIPVTANPELLRDPDTGTRSSCIFWQKRNLNRFADKGDVRGARKVWNGGYHGLDMVETTYAVAVRVLSGKPKPSSIKRKKKPALKSSTAIRELQAKLCRAGYKTAIDGLIGEHTRQTIKKFQAGNGLIIDGVAGVKTIAALNEQLGPKSKNKNTPTKIAPSETTQHEEPPETASQGRGKGVIAAIAALALSGIMAIGAAVHAAWGKFWASFENLISTLF